jgi:soluble lytic murein transglycosylase-like protein
MYRRALEFAMLLLAVPMWAQHYSVPAASVGDAFSAYHEALSSAADNLLAARTERGAVTASAISVPRPNGTAMHRFAEQYWNGQEQNVRGAVARVAQLRPVLEPILRQEGIPSDVVALVLVESGGRTTALSPKGALGLWQLMPDTARRYGLSVSAVRDERMDLVKSTHAAARYLRDLYARFGDWNLTFAAYNAGEQAVQRAIARNGSRDFVSLSRARRLALETRNYVPAVLSAMRLPGGSAKLEAVANVPSGRRSGSIRVLFAKADAGD